MVGIEPLIDWECFRLIIAGMFNNKAERSGKPNNEEIIMMKTMRLQPWYGLTDPEIERQIIDLFLLESF